MNITTSQQIEIFAMALALGAILCIVYDFFRVLRLIGLNSTVLTFVEDILFFLICTFAFFLFYMGVTNGKFRPIVLLAAAIGFYIYRMTIGRIVFGIIKYIINFLLKIFRFVYDKFFYKIFCILRKLIVKVLKLIKRFFCDCIAKNVKIFFKKLLPKNLFVLYNNKNSMGSRLIRNKRKEGSINGSSNKKEKTFFC